jgi:hypothetical protein
MLEAQMSALQQEWLTLQTQFDSYEKCSLGIKLFSVLLCCFLVFSIENHLAAIIFISILWLQDSIWKTFQSRIAQRLETIELAIKAQLEEAQLSDSQLGMQFNNAWLTSRLTGLSLLTEYLKQAIKPTVAYPHVILFIVAIVAFFVR